MPQIASDIIQPSYLESYYHWQQLPNGIDVPSNVVRTDPPQLNSEIPDDGGGSQGLQQPADERPRDEDFDIAFAREGPMVAVRQNGYESDSDDGDEPVHSEEGVAEHQLAFSDAEWHEIRAVYERLRRHEARPCYPGHFLYNNHQTIRDSQEESPQPSGVATPSSTLVNYNISTPSSMVTSIAISSACDSSSTSTRSQSPNTILRGISGSSHFSNELPSPRFLWLAPVLLHDIVYTIRYAPRLAILDEEDVDDFRGT